MEKQKTKRIRRKPGQRTQAGRPGAGPGWVRIRTALLRVLDGYPDAREELERALAQTLEKGGAG